MTSANVTYYRIERDGKIVGSHRQHHYCKTKWEDLLKFKPIEDHTITPYGEDEYEVPWEDKTEGLKQFLEKRRVRI